MPTSMPRVGSSMIRISGSAFSHLPMMTFLLVAAGEIADLLLREGVFDVNQLDVPVRDLVFTFVLVSRPRRSFGRLAMLMLALMVKSSVRPLDLAVFGQKGDVAFLCRGGRRDAHLLLWTYTSQDVM